MLDTLKRYFGDLVAHEPEKVFDEDDPRLAVAALMFHVVAADGVVTPQESRRLIEELARHYGLTVAEASELGETARQAELETATLQRFTAGLQRKLDPDQRRDIVASLWRVVFADGAVHEFEDNVLWRIADLLGIPSHERVAIRKAIEAEEEARRPTSEDERS
jgi:uncharacterized tellurite resistance protein B-like protein